MHPRVAVHLAHWISPEFAVKVTDLVLRFIQGDVSLVGDVLDRHDHVNNTTSAAVVVSVPNELLARRQVVDTEMLELAVREKRIVLDERQVGIDERQIGIDERRATLNAKELALVRSAADDIHLFSCIKDEFIAQHGHKRPHAAIEPPMSVDLDPMLNKDLTTLAREAGITRKLTPSELSSLGMCVLSEYQQRYTGQHPDRTKKHVNGGNRDVNVYIPRDHAWIIELIRRRLSTPL